MLYKALKLPPIKETREAAVDAIKRLAALLDGFPFVNDESKAVALSGIFNAGCCAARSR